MTYDFDAYVTAVHFDRAGRAAFALGDGTVRFEGGESVAAHDGAVLCARPHPLEDGLLTGGDDGVVTWSRPSGAVAVAEAKGRWIDALDASAASGLIAFAAGRDLHVRDLKDAGFARTFTHEKSVADVAFDPKGRRIAAATYGGAALWYARIEGQKPTMLKWAGSHVVLAWSPDAKFLVSSMQENQLHAWQVAGEKNLRMGGYPAKVKSLAFLSKGRLMVTSGASGAVLWPFSGGAGPAGQQGVEIGPEPDALVMRVAATPDGDRILAGLNDGRVWAADVKTGRRELLKAQKGPEITALALSPDGLRAAWGDEEGGAAVEAVALEAA